MEPNFSGYVTKADLECADGRTILNGAFKHQDGLKVPLVYQHNHTDINQVLGHVILKHKDDGVWGDAYLNMDTPQGVNANSLVKNKDLDKFSIWAKNLVERGHLVHDGDIQEVSLVLAGANAGATVANVLMHSGLEEDEDNFIFLSAGELKHADGSEFTPPEEKAETKVEEKTEESGKTMADVLATLNDEQTTAVNAFVDGIVTEAVTEALSKEESQIEHDNLDPGKGTQMSRNVFDGTNSTDTSKNQLKHSDVQSVLNAAKGPSGEGGANASHSIRELVRSSTGKELMHAADYGVENIEILFPEAQALMNTPVFIDRRQEWVKTFINGTHKSPFSRVKTMYADITADEARARGYIKAGKKVEEVFPVFKRTTGPAMIYKKQKLDRQDIIDIVDFDVVAWMKVEMRGKLDEELARAGLFGDGRPVMVAGELNPDKIPEPTGTSGDGIRSVINDNDLYTQTYDVDLGPAGDEDWNVLLDDVTLASEHYRGSGNKTAFMSYRTATKLLTIRDGFQKRVYRNLSEVAGDMDVARIERVPTELFPDGVLCIVLDLKDYNFGTNRGGEVTLFDDFDIDFNQYKYLIETYLSGALVLPFSAQVFRSVLSTATQIAPVEPVAVNNVVTIPTQTGVVYKRVDTGATVAAASTITLNSTTLKKVEIEASPSSTAYYFGDNRDETDTWVFEYKA